MVQTNNTKLYNNPSYWTLIENHTLNENMDASLLACKNLRYKMFFFYRAPFIITLCVVVLLKYKWGSYNLMS